MSELFDIQFVTSHFQTCNLKHYTDKIPGASSSDLKSFRALVVAHGKQARPSGSFVNVEGLSSHGAIISAIDYELLKRSPIRFKAWSLLLPVRRFLVATFSGMDLRAHEVFGVLYVSRTRQQSVWHTPHTEVFQKIVGFVRKHEGAFVAAVLSVIAAGVIRWLAF
jgi:hypothetical protein